MDRFIDTDYINTPNPTTDWSKWREEKLNDIEYRRKKREENKANHRAFLNKKFKKK